ncbi:MAG TPA: hypothetical protein VLC95_12445 [Anaerolineae bacterium]|nr:hypothetical protein [Anaerolineae bacterium]
MPIILIVLFVAFLIGMWLMRRNQVAPPGTYDSEDYRSGGSIGGGRRTYDSPEYRSGGSIGGQGRRTYDDPEYRSGGSIGGGPSVRGTASPTRERRQATRPVYDDDEFESGGSIGG